MLGAILNPREIVPGRTATVSTRVGVECAASHLFDIVLALEGLEDMLAGIGIMDERVPLRAVDELEVLRVWATVD